MKSIRCALACLFFLHPFVWADNNLQQECLRDLNALPEFIVDNDAGGKDIFQEKGALYFSLALQESEQGIAGVVTDKDCQRILRTYLQFWRKGHLEIETLETEKDNKSAASSAGGSDTENSKPAVEPTPELHFLSANTLVLRLPNFSPKNRKPLIDLLAQHRKKFERTANWIIDVRGNGGGSDSSFTPLLSWILANETLHFGASWLVTPHNIEAQRNLCAQYAPGDKGCIKRLEKAVTRMEGKPIGTYVPQNNGPLISYNPSKEHFHPDRVALVIDRNCGSSCEEFVLRLRQSFNVKTIGTRTFGALDYSNLRSYPLPSGKRDLWYATSRSNRLPDIKVDGNGITPDIYFPVPAGAEGKKLYISRIQSWIEGESLVVEKP